MDFKRGILYFALAIVGVMLWHAWQNDYLQKQSAASQSTTQTTAQQPLTFTPTAYRQVDSSSQPVNNTSQNVKKDQFITVKTDTLEAQINLNGGNLVSA